MEYSAFEDRALARLCTKGKAITFAVVDSSSFFFSLAFCINLCCLLMLV